MDTRGTAKYPAAFSMVRRLKTTWVVLVPMSMPTLTISATVHPLSQVYERL